MDRFIHGPGIYDGIEALGLQTDLQGWNSDRPIFRELLAETRPRTIFEVGSWKGRSAIHMAKAGEEYRPLIICIDTWLGSPEIWSNPRLAAATPHKHGYPQVYFQFLHNVKAAGCANCIFPLVQTSACAARLLALAGMQAQLIYLDGSHEYRDFRHDLEDYWPLLEPGGVMFGDDYNEKFPGVRRAAQEFAAELGLPLDEREGNFWILRKANKAAG